MYAVRSAKMLSHARAARAADAPSCPLESGSAATPLGDYDAFANDYDDLNDGSAAELFGAPQPRLPQQRL